MLFSASAGRGTGLNSGLGSGASSGRRSSVGLGTKLGTAPQGQKTRRHYGWLIALLTLSLVLTTVWFREGDRGPLHRMRVGIQTVTTPIGAGGKWVTTPMHRFLFWVTDLGVSRSEVKNLREQNEALRARVVRLEEQQLESERYRALVGEEATASAEATGLAAAVIGLPSTTYEQVIVLNKGSAAGVALNQPVVTTRGLLGQIIELGSNYSKVRLITDQKSGVAALVQRDRLPGVVRGSLQGELLLDFVPTTAKVRAGDIVLTSGLGGVYPKGLVIGEITTVSDEVNTLYKSIKVSPINALDALEDVLILTNAPPDVKDLAVSDL